MSPKRIAKCDLTTLTLLKDPHPVPLPHLHQLHSRLVVSGAISDPFGAAHLLLSFVPHSLPYSRRLHRHLPNPSLFSSNSLLRAHLDSSSPLKTLAFLRRLLSSSPSRFRPNNYTFSFALRASLPFPPPISSLLAASLHSLTLLSGWEPHHFVRNGLLHLYASCGFLRSARRLFDSAASRDVITWTSLFHAYAKAGLSDAARRIFDEMPERNAVSWSAMVAACVRAGRFAEAVRAFARMQAEGVPPNHAGVVCALTACGALGALEQGRWVHAFAERSGMELDRVLGTALVDMYAKCGCMDTAAQVFAAMAERDVFAYTSMVSGLSNHGRCEEAIALFGRMQADGVRPNEVTFICVLSACARVGLVDRGREIFRSMTEVYGIEPGVEHYGSFVDLLGRAGLLGEAVDVVKGMPMKPDSYVLGALLNACTVHGDAERGRQVVECLAELGLDHSGVHVLLSNMFASSCKWEDVARVRKRMEEKNVMKVPGCSMIEVDGVACEFIAGDRSHPQMAETLVTAREMDNQVRLFGNDHYLAEFVRQIDSCG